MALVTVKTLLDAAEKGNYAVGAFNCNNMEIVQAIVEAAEKENSPVIIQASQGRLIRGPGLYRGFVQRSGEKCPCAHCSPSGSRHGYDPGYPLHCRRFYLCHVGRFCQAL